MNKKKIIVLVFIVFLLIVLFTSIMKLFVNNENDENTVSLSDEYVYGFGNTLDLEEQSGFEEYVVTGTDYPSLGTENEYFDIDSEIITYDDKMDMQTFKGYITVSASWMDEGMAKKIKEPEFGNIKKFILSTNDTISVRYDDVRLKDVEKYIDELTDAGFIKVILDNKNKKKDYYYYTAEKLDGSKVSLNYSNSEFYIEVY